MRRERSLAAALDESASRLGDWLAAQESSPSQKVDSPGEMLRMTERSASLPENQRRVIELHHLQGWTLAEIASRAGHHQGGSGRPAPSRAEGLASRAG